MLINILKTMTGYGVGSASWLVSKLVAPLACALVTVLIKVLEFVGTILLAFLIIAACLAIVAFPGVVVWEVAGNGPVAGIISIGWLIFCILIVTD